MPVRGNKENYLSAARDAFEISVFEVFDSFNCLTFYSLLNSLVCPQNLCTRVASAYSCSEFPTFFPPSLMIPFGAIKR